MREFGWTIDYVLGLTFPVFFDLFGLIRRIRMDAAIDEFYMPYSAAKYGGKCAKNLFDGRGTITIADNEQPDCQVTGEAIELARKRLAKIIKARQNLLTHIAEN